MFEFSIQKSGASDEKLIRFQSDADNPEFRSALTTVLQPHGFAFDYGDYHIRIENKRGDKKLGKLTISSDEWFVWGESNTWGKDITLNQELIAWLEKELLSSGLFKHREST